MKLSHKRSIILYMITFLVAGVALLLHPKIEEPVRHQSDTEKEEGPKPAPNANASNEDNEPVDEKARDLKPTQLSKTRWETEVQNWVAFSGSSDAKILDVSEVSAADLNIPFLGKNLNDKPIISVELQTKSIMFGDKTSHYENSSLNKVRCTFVADTGQLVQIEIEKDGVGKLPGEMVAGKAEERYKWTGEQYHELPLEKPAVKFQDILNRVSAVGLAKVWESRKIIARYVVNSRDGVFGNEPRWIVSFYGFPPIPALGISKSSDEERSHLRYLFSKDGEFFRADNRP